MKKTMLLLLLTVSLILAGCSDTQLSQQKARGIESYVDFTTKASSQTPWLLLRTEAGEDPNTIVGLTAITQATAGDYWSKPTEPNGLVTLEAYQSDDGYSTDAYMIEVIAAGCAATDANDKTFTVVIWGYERKNGPAAPICSIAFTTGTQELVKYPVAMPRAQTPILAGDAAPVTCHWADTAVATSYWYSDMITVANSGNNGIARVRIMLYGQAYIKAVVSGANGSPSTEATKVSLYYRKISG